MTLVEENLTCKEVNVFWNGLKNIQDSCGDRCTSLTCYPCALPRNTAVHSFCMLVFPKP